MFVYVEKCRHSTWQTLFEWELNDYNAVCTNKNRHHNNNNNNKRVKNNAAEWLSGYRPATGTFMYNIRYEICPITFCSSKELYIFFYPCIYEWELNIVVHSREPRKEIISIKKLNIENKKAPNCD